MLFLFCNVPYFYLIISEYIWYWGPSIIYFPYFQTHFTDFISSSLKAQIFVLSEYILNSPESRLSWSGNRQHKKEKSYSSLRSMIRIIFFSYSNDWFIALFDIWQRYAKSLQSCPILCDPIDSSPPGSAVPGILQARILEWAAIAFSNAWRW